MQPVSVVITCFNLERFIAEAVESVLAQDYGGEVEIIAVDDCSTDASADRIRRYPQVRYLRTAQNGGVLLATLAGIETASHDVIAFLDGDDIWEPTKLTAVAKCFESDPKITLVTHDLHYADGAGQPTDHRTRPSEVLSPLPSDAVSEPVRKGILEHDDYVWLGSALSIRASLARVDEFASWARELADPANTYQDWPLAFWIAALDTTRLGYVPGKLFRYRVHDLNYSGDAASAAKAVRNFSRTRNTLRAMEGIAVMRGLSEQIRARLARGARFNDYLVDLYSGRRTVAAGGLLKSLGYIRERGVTIKELTRFAGVELFGPTIFARQAKSLSTLRASAR